MESECIRYKSSEIHWARFGDGDKLVFCFHGYGEESASFRFLDKQSGPGYRYIAIDLPYHGKTKWNEGKPFMIEQLGEIIDMICERIGREGARFSLMGFSLGGRISLSVYELMHERVDRLVLLAPDGLKVNPWYWFATRTLIGSRIFLFTMEHPQWLFGLLRLTNSLKLINASVFKFAKYYVHDAPIRKLLYARWMVLGKFRPSLKKIKVLIQSNDTTVRLIYGKHDRIIIAAVGEKFRKGIEQQSTLRTIEAGHQVLHEKHAADIVRALED